MVTFLRAAASAMALLPFASKSSVLRIQVGTQARIG
jgi:hypothetical protein